MTRVFRGILLVAGILAMTAGSARAQAIGQIFGKVTDATGGVLPGVTVTVAGSGLQQPLTSVTTSTGAYQFPTVPIGTYTVTFELTGFKKSVRPNVVIVSGFNAQIDMKLEVGEKSVEMTVTAAAPVVDTKKTTTGGTFTKETLEQIPTARDPWQIINMAPAVQAGLNVGGSSSGQQVGLSVYGTGGSVQWNLEGGSITDVSSNSSPSYFNFDSFEQIQVVTGGGDVSVQSSGLSINLVTKSGSNVFKGSVTSTYENDSMQSNNVTRGLFYSSATGFLSGSPVKRISNNSIEYGGPVLRNRLWWWAAADKQGIHDGTLNFFDPSGGSFCSGLVAAQKAGTLSSAITYDNLKQVQRCLKDDKVIIKDLEWKFNYQLNASNKFQYLFTSDNKYRNTRGSGPNTATEATFQQTSDAPWKLPLPTHSITHTLILTDKLVFTNQFTYVDGGFFLDYQDVPIQGNCLQSRYLGSSDFNAYLTGTRASASCLWNVQTLSNRTTGFRSRSPQSVYQTVRKTWELKTDGNYFLSNVMGGDHALKFGLGWRKAPIMSFSHYSGGAEAQLQCVGNSSANCGAGLPVPVGSATGYVPRTATLFRDQLLNNFWHTYDGYLQDSYSRGKLRLNGGVRYDWQTSKWLGGCIPANIIRPDLLPAQCESATDTDPTTGKKISPFSNFAPRFAATYDLRGNGKTSIHASVGYYFQTKITVANGLGGLLIQPALTWGPNQTSGACSTTAGASCWNDANSDGLVQGNELIGTPGVSSSTCSLTTGICSPTGNTVDPKSKLLRTREFIVGMQHELVPNMAVGVDVVYRRYDNGTAAYTLGAQPGQPNCAPGQVITTPPTCFPLSSLYVGPFNYTDPQSGLTAPYYIVCTGCQRPSGVGSITTTNHQYTTYHGVIMTVNKRFSNRWQMQGSVTWQKSPTFATASQLFSANAGSNNNPTGLVFTNGYSTLARFLFKLNGSVSLPWGLNASANLNVNDGANRTLSINGPGQVYGGVNTSGAATTITYNTLNFQPAGTTRFDPTKLLDVELSKVISFRGGKDRVTLMLDCFNVFNTNTILSFSSNNLDSSTFNSPSSIVPPRIFRVGARIAF